MYSTIVKSKKDLLGAILPNGHQGTDITLRWMKANTPQFKENIILYTYYSFGLFNILRKHFCLDSFKQKLFFKFNFWKI